MKQTFLLSWIALGAMLSVNIPVVSQETAPGTTVTNESSILKGFESGSKNTLYFGVEFDSYPISYKQNGTPEGFCVEFAGFLEQQLNQRYNRSNQNSIEVEYVDVSKEERFNFLRGTDDGQRVDIECGPNTIPGNFKNETKDSKKIDLLQKCFFDNVFVYFYPFTPSPLPFTLTSARSLMYQNIIFSQAFFTTGTRLLIKKESREEVDNSPGFEGKSIGVIQDTTTYSVIGNVYRNAQRVSPNPSTRKKGIEGVGSSTIAYATDSLILEAELEGKEASALNSINNPDDYYLFPEDHFLSIEPYGLAFHDSQGIWRDYVSRLLESPGGQRIIKEQLESKYDSLSTISRKANKGREQKAQELKQLTGNLQRSQLAVKLLFIVLSLVILAAIIWLGYSFYSKSNTAEITFDKEDKFDWNAFISAFKEVQKDHNVVLLTISEFGMKSDSELSFLVSLSKSQLKKEKFITKFRSEYGSALQRVRDQHQKGEQEGQIQGHSLNDFIITINNPISNNQHATENHRNINTYSGNYNESIDGDYIQGQKNEKTDD